MNDEKLADGNPQKQECSNPFHNQLFTSPLLLFLPSHRYIDNYLAICEH